MVVLGRIVAPFGVQGWLKIHPFGDDPVAWRDMSAWWIGRDPESQRSEDWLSYVPRGLRVQGKGVVLAVEGVADRTAAESLSGYFLAAPRDQLPKPLPGEYYWGDLVGLRVRNKAGLDFGLVESLLETGTHDVLVITNGDTERMIPFVGAYVLDVDQSSGVVLVDWEADW